MTFHDSRGKSEPTLEKASRCELAYDCTIARQVLKSKSDAMRFEPSQSGIRMSVKPPILRSTLSCWETSPSCLNSNPTPGPRKIGRKRSPRTPWDRSWHTLPQWSAFYVLFWGRTGNRRFWTASRPRGGAWEMPRPESQEYIRIKHR